MPWRGAACRQRGDEVTCDGVARSDEPSQVLEALNGVIGGLEIAKVKPARVVDNCGEGVRGT